MTCEIRNLKYFGLFLLKFTILLLLLLQQIMVPYLALSFFKMKASVKIIGGRSPPLVSATGVSILTSSHSKDVSYIIGTIKVEQSNCLLLMSDDRSQWRETLTSKVVPNSCAD